MQQSLEDAQYYADLPKEWFDKFLDSYEKRIDYCKTTDFLCSKDGYVLEIDYVFNKTDLSIYDTFVFDYNYTNGKQEFEITWLYKKDSEHQVRNKELIFNENYINEIEVLFIDNMEHFSKRMKEITGLENEVVFYLCSTEHYITVSSQRMFKRFMTLSDNCQILCQSCYIRKSEKQINMINKRAFHLGDALFVFAT